MLAIATTLLLSMTGSMMYSGTTPYSDGPPPGHTGGFGEPTCYQCHADGTADDPGLMIAIMGLPEAHIPGQTYNLTVMVSHPEMKAGGFQVSARYDTGAREGKQAGQIASVGPVRIAVDSAGVAYASHTEPVEGDSVTWNLEWTAPPPNDSVVFHVAANAANHDDSEFGDRTGSASFVSAPHRSEASKTDDTDQSSAASKSGTEASR